MAQSPPDEQIAILALSREQCRNHLSSTRNHKFDKIVVGAAIIHLTTDAHSRLEEPHILLLKRSANEIYYPNVFEMPGGKVDADDPSIRDALVREVKEETGLDLTRVFGQLPDMIYSTERKVSQENGNQKLMKKSCIQLNFAVEVDLAHGTTFQVNPVEHSTGVWASKRMLGELEMTEAMRGVVSVALEQSRKAGRGNPRDQF